MQHEMSRSQAGLGTIRNDSLVLYSRVFASHPQAMAGHLDTQRVALEAILNTLS